MDEDPKTSGHSTSGEGWVLPWVASESDKWLTGSPDYGNVHRDWLESAGTALHGVPLGVEESVTR